VSNLEPTPQWNPGPPEVRAPRSTLSRIGELLAWLGLVGIVAAVAIPEFAGHPVDSKSLPSAFIGFALFPFLIARLRGLAAPWAYAVGGVTVLFGLFFAGGALRKDTPAQAAFNEMVVALREFDPETATRVASPSVRESAQFIMILQPALTRAAQLAPDADLVAYNESLQAMLFTPSGVNRPRCEMLAMGKHTAPASIDEQVYMARATTRLVRSAVGRTSSPPIDRERAAAVIMQVLAEADPTGVTRDQTAMARITPAQACDLYLRIIEVTRALPEADKALMLRSKLVPG
jgi:hypothetical protein